MGFVLSSSAVTQWLALGPLIRSERSKGRSETSNGLMASGIGGIVVGCILFLLGSACGLHAVGP